MNKTKIDWVDSTWNPVTGCLHDCQYCYARKMANQYSLLKSGAGIKEHIGFFENVIGMEQGEDFTVVNDSCIYLHTPVAFGEQKSGYPTRFDIPTFHSNRLNDFQKKKGRTIFVCSMADLFGEWVSDDWIQEVFKACEVAPQHRYLFLTKNPKRYESLMTELPLPNSSNYWYGMSYTHMIDGIIPGALEFLRAYSLNKFFSIEPILEPLHLGITREYIKWVILGAETGHRKDKVVPKREWIKNLVDECQYAGIPIFMKSSLTDIWDEELIQEYPWEVKV